VVDGYVDICKNNTVYASIQLAIHDYCVSSSRPWLLSHLQFTDGVRVSQMSPRNAEPVPQTEKESSGGTNYAKQMKQNVSP
jgi:hypothetical protein